MTAELSSRFKEDGMLAYVELIQRKEKEIGCDVLTHQKWYVFPQLSAIRVKKVVRVVGVGRIILIRYYPPCHLAHQARLP